MTRLDDFYAVSDREQVARLTLLAQAAATHWEGGFADLNLVKYRENAVFSAQRPNGERIAVRIHRHDYHTDAALASELHWMHEITCSGAVEVPPVIPAASGQLVVKVTHPAVPEPRRVSVLGWLAGAPVGTSESGVALADDAAVKLYFEAGAVAGALHNQSSAMTCPDGFTRHAWDENGLLGDAPLWGRFWDSPTITGAQRDLFQRARAAAQLDLLAFDKTRRNFGLVHADFVPENLISEGGRLKIIDFDDCGYGWYLFELATALYFNIDDPCYPQIRDALVDGYRTVRELSSDDAKLLPLFLFLRGTTYVGWVQSRPETETAKAMGPMLIERACLLAERYLRGRDA